MEKYLNKGIKEVMELFPEVGIILDNFGVGCVNCGVGTCLLKDIIGIHNLSKYDEIELMARIEKAIYPERDIKIVHSIDKENDKRETPITYSEPIMQLVEEHKNIKKLLNSIPKICEMIGNSFKFESELVLECVGFIKNYADKFHHSKEEDILFKYADENSDVIKSMLEEHKIARWLVKSILKGVEKQDRDLVIENLTGYGELLSNHIKKEDEILYPFIDRNITKEQIDELNNSFKLSDSSFENNFIGKWDGFLKKIENSN